MRAPAGLDVDHIDGDGLNNRRSNLRACTHTENGRNRKLSKNNTSGLKGVNAREAGKWQAMIKTSGRILHLGVFDSKMEAAKAYDAAALRLYGEFARTNAALGLIDGEP